MNPFPVQRASQLASSGPQTQWLVQDLWTEQAVGILGGEGAHRENRSPQVDLRNQTHAAHSAS
jgi:hypothetical protein